MALITRRHFWGGLREKLEYQTEKIHPKIELLPILAKGCLDGLLTLKSEERKKDLGDEYLSGGLLSTSRKAK